MPDDLKTQLAARLSRRRQEATQNKEQRVTPVRVENFEETEAQREARIMETPEAWT